MCKCFDALITPILEYGSQIWDFQSRRLSEIEIIHRKFCKFILNVPSSATNAGVYGELGRKPMSLRRNLLTVKYWLRLLTSYNIGMFGHAPEAKLTLDYAHKEVIGPLWSILHVS